MAKGLGKGLEALFQDTNEAFEHIYESGKPFEYTEEERRNAQDLPLEKSRQIPISREKTLTNRL